MTMQETQILVRAIGIQKENWGNNTFLEIIKQQLFWNAVKYKTMYGFFSKALLSLNNAQLPPIFFLDTKSAC